MIASKHMSWNEFSLHSKALSLSSSTDRKQIHLHCCSQATMNLYDSICCILVWLVSFAVFYVSIRNQRLSYDYYWPYQGTILSNYTKLQLGRIIFPISSFHFIFLCMFHFYFFTLTWHGVVALHYGLWSAFITVDSKKIW